VDDLQRENANSKQEIANLKKQVGDLQKENANSKQEIARLSRESSSSKQEVANLKTKGANLEQKIENNIIEQGKCGNNATWILTKDLILTISGFGTMNNYEENGSPWNKYREKIQQIYINDGIKSVGDYAFFKCGCSKLKLANTITFIGECAFAHCTYLENITLPEKLSYMGHHAFYDCNSFHMLNIPTSLKVVPESAFAYSESLNRVIFLGDINSIEKNAFDSCTNLSYVEFKGNVRLIKENAFLLCTSMSSVDFSKNFGTIESAAFRCNWNLARINLGVYSNTPPTGRIRKGAFANTWSLKFVEIPVSVKMEYGAFDDDVDIRKM
jgi:hypothetical protein